MLEQILNFALIVIQVAVLVVLWLLHNSLKATCFFGHLESYTREVFVPRLAGKSQYHVKMGGQRQYKPYGVVAYCSRCDKFRVKVHE